MTAPRLIKVAAEDFPANLYYAVPRGMDVDTAKRAVEDAFGCMYADEANDDCLAWVKTTLAKCGLVEAEIYLSEATF
jgi:hypothetical protein